jgi:hypothetical protein
MIDNQKILEASNNGINNQRIDDNEDEYGTILDISEEDNEDLEEIDIWDKNLNSLDLFKSDFISYLQTFFD